MGRELLLKKVEIDEDIDLFFKDIQDVLLNRDSYKPTPQQITEVDLMKYCFFRLGSLMYDEKIPYREAFENVLSTLESEQFNFVYLLSGDENGITIYLGLVDNAREKDSPLSVVNYGRKFEAAFSSYFQGSTLNKLVQHEIEDEILNPLFDISRASIITGIPSINESTASKNLDFQGIDRLINSMSGENFKLLIVAERVDQQEVAFLQEQIYSMYDTLHLKSTQSIQLSDNDSFGFSRTDTEGKSKTKTKGTSKSKAHTNGESRDKSNGVNKNTSNSTTEGSSDSKAEGSSSSETTGITTQRGKSQAVTLDVVNKKIQELLKYIDEDLLSRVKLGMTKGLYKTSMYVLGENLDQHDRLKSNVQAIFQGDKPTVSPLQVRQIQAEKQQDIYGLLCRFQTNSTSIFMREETALIYGFPTDGHRIQLASYMTANEISLIASLPHKEIIGLPLMEGVDFGLNIKQNNVQKDEAIMLGSLVKRGQRQTNVPIFLTKSQLNKHLFVAGVTGSGKTTTCQKLLIESSLPFLVIEPAKTEYRGMVDLKGMEDIIIFTLGNEKASPFRLNPFEFFEGESISSHIDLLKATFTAAFPMEAAMPQILEKAMYRCYEKCGWDYTDDTNKYTNNPWSGYGEYFPTLSQLVDELENVVNDQGFGNELRQNYIGSLIARLSNLTVGVKGKMLNCTLSIDFEELLTKKVIIEMEDVKSAEDKALLMGLIMSRISEALKKKHKQDKTFRHITLVEEAHRLLSKIEIGDASSKKAAVETFADMLAEVRKYGEALIIVDQIPNKLASEVLKNTNTKLIHRLFARDDKEVIGDTMLMSDRQKEYLSSLKVGEAILFTEGFHKPVHMGIDPLTDTSNNEISEERIKQIGQAQMQQYKKSFFPLVSRLNYPVLTAFEEIKFAYRQYVHLKENKKQLTKEKWVDFVNVLSKVGGIGQISAKEVWRQFCIQHAHETSKLVENQYNIKDLERAADQCFDLLTEDVRTLFDGNESFLWIFN